MLNEDLKLKELNKFLILVLDLLKIFRKRVLNDVDYFFVSKRKK